MPGYRNQNFSGGHGTIVAKNPYNIDLIPTFGAQRLVGHGRFPRRHQIDRTPHENEHRRTDRRHATSQVARFTHGLGRHAACVENDDLRVRFQRDNLMSRLDQIPGDAFIFGFIQTTSQIMKGYPYHARSSLLSKLSLFTVMVFQRSHRDASRFLTIPPHG